MSKKNWKSEQIGSPLHLKQLRIPKPNKISFRTIRYSRKLNQPIISDFPEDNIIKNKVKGESILENAFMVLCEQEARIIEYLPQAVAKNKVGMFQPLPYTRLDGVEETWTPDFSIIWSNRKPWVVEVKRVKEIMENWEKLSHKFEQAEVYCQANGWEFYVFTDANDSQSFRVDNLVDLESQLQFATKDCKKVLLSCFKEKSSWTVKELQEKLEPEAYSKEEVLASTFSLIYFDKLFINLDEELTLETLITTDARLLVPLDEWLSQFDWKRLKKPEGFSIVDENQLTLKQREKFRRDTAIVKAYSEGVHPKEICRKYGIKSIQTVYNLWERSENGSKLTNLLRKKEPGSGRPKHTLFEIQDQSTKTVFFSDPHFEKIISQYESPLRPDKDECWRSFLRLKRAWAYEHGLTKKPNASFRALREAFRDARRTFPSKDIFLNELDRYHQEFLERVLRRREGIKRATKLLRNVTSSTPYMNYIGQICEIDHTPADILGVIPLSIYHELKLLEKKAKAKPYYMDKAIITVVIDLHTRVILGYAFRYRRESRETTFLALRRTVVGNINPFLDEDEQKNSSTAEKILRAFKGLVSEEKLQKIVKEFDQWGGLRELADWWDSLQVLPRILHTDNGRDFQSKDVENWGYKYHVKFAFRPIGGANYGGHVERVLGTLNRRAFHSIPGTTKGRPSKRGDYPSEKLAVLTYEEMEAIFLLTVLLYHVTPHKGLGGIPPIEAWRRAIQQGNNLSSLRTKGELQDFVLHALPTETKSYSDNKGIHLNTLVYNYEAQPGEPQDKSWIEIYNKGDKLEVRTDSSDIRFVWWWNSQLGRPIRIWTTKIRIKDREYSGNKLKRLGPISKAAWDDIRTDNKARMGLVRAELYEETVASAENVLFTVKEEIPKTKKEQEQYFQKKMREIEVQRVATIELQETAGLLSERLPEQITDLSRGITSGEEQERIGEIAEQEDEEEIELPEPQILPTIDNTAPGITSSLKKVEKEAEEVDLPPAKILPTSDER
ncbi:MAG: TnsA endonuclease N-terminal domain-containing protein [Candidatus Heimdallarchaeota archaeon]